MSQKEKVNAAASQEVQSGEPSTRNASQAAILGILTGERARKQASSDGDDKRCDAEWALGVEWTLRMMS
jgi:hypothetical protein